MGEELAIQDTQTANLPELKRRADLRIELATYWAEKLMDVVEKRNMAKNIGGKKYLEVEGWQVVGELSGVTPIVEWTRPWMDGDKKVGYEARVQLVDREGRVVSAGESSCGFDAFPCRGKVGSEQEKAARSAAQTWAASRAYRMKFSFVAKLAGYEPTPAEEMPTTDTSVISGTPMGSTPKAKRAEVKPQHAVETWRSDFKDALVKMAGSEGKALAILGTHGYENWVQIPDRQKALDIYAEVKEKK
jgi:hypothetical protein